jgi:glycosyltransferase involved in cell wall biosynthesis
VKTVLINYTGRKGGGAHYSLEMTKALKSKGINIVAILSEDLENKDLWNSLDISIYYLKTYSSYFSFVISYFRLLFKTKFDLKKYLSQFDIDFIYIPMEQPLTKMINRIVKKPYLLTVHDLNPHSGDNMFSKLIGDCLNRGLRKNADGIILLSKLFIELYIKKYKYNSEKIIHVKHGFFNSILNLPAESIDLNTVKKTNFVFFGRISEYKGIDILLKSYSKLSDEFDDTSLIIAGSGSLENYTDEISRLKNLTLINRWISDGELNYILNQPNIIIVLPYKDATQSGVISLAQMYKVPVIASKTGGLSEQLEHGKLGVLVNSNDVDDLYKTMKSAHLGEINFKVMTNLAYKQGSNLWSFGADGILELYDKIQYKFNKYNISNDQEDKK